MTCRESLFVNRTFAPSAIRGDASLTPFALRVTVAPTALLPPEGDDGVMSENTAERLGGPSERVTPRGSSS